MYILRKKHPKVKKQKNYIFSLMTTFSNFALEIEISLAKKIVKASLETWNARCCYCVCLVYSFPKKKIPGYCLSVCEGAGSGSEELKKCPPPSHAVVWFVNVREKKAKTDR